MLVVIAYLARQDARRGKDGWGIAPAGPVHLPGAPFDARVTGVADGDTLTAVDGERRAIRIRLHGIDAPELRQASGRRSRAALAALVSGRTVRVAAIETDRYERLVADLYVGTNWINAALVADGWAWHYRHHSADGRLAAAERRARDRSLGLWRDRAPTPPWQWRQWSGNRSRSDDR